MKDLRPLHFFLGIQVKRSSHGFFLNQAQYAEDIIDHAEISNYKVASTPTNTSPKLSACDGDLVSNPMFYHSITGALQYLTITRPDLAYVVNQDCLHMHAPSLESCQTNSSLSSSHDLHMSGTPSNCLTAYSNKDWAGCPNTHRSTSSYCVFLRGSLMSWSSKRQTMVSQSSAEAEYRTVANETAECCWL
jgi:hypothetical protein